MSSTADQQNKVHILCEGYSHSDSNEANCMRANCTCTLIQTKNGRNIIVDTMTAWDGDRIVAALKEHNLTPSNIDVVVCTHGHSDHIGCNFLFPDAQWHFVGTSVSNRDKYLNWDFAKSEYHIDDEEVVVVATPGHTLSCVSVIVRDSNLGRIVGICGDLFESEEDIDDEHIWLEAGSEDPMAQRKHRLKIAERCLFIVPGHGPGFKMTETKRVKLSQNLDCALGEQNTNNISKGEGCFEKTVKSESLPALEKVYGIRDKRLMKRKQLPTSKVAAKTAAMSTLQTSIGPSRSQLSSPGVSRISTTPTTHAGPQGVSTTTKQEPFLEPSAPTINRKWHNDYEIQTKLIQQSRSIQQSGKMDRNSSKMLILLASGEQRLITYTLPKGSVTVKQLLEQVGVPFDDSTAIRCVQNLGEDIEYIVAIDYLIEASASELISRAKQYKTL